MLKAKIENTVTGRKFGAKFETLEELESWQDKQIRKGSWGKPDRSIKLGLEEIAEEGFTTTKDIILVEASELQGLPQEEIKGIEYFYPCEYEIVIEDLTEEVKAEKKAKDDDKKEIKAIKKLVKDLHKFETVGEFRTEVQRILKRIVKELKDE